MNWKLRDTDIQEGPGERSTFIVVDFDDMTIQLEDFGDDGLVLSNCLKIKARPVCAQYMRVIFAKIIELLGHIVRAKDVSEDLLCQLEKIVDEHSY